MSNLINAHALKQKIIEAGIKGKLVPQIASEGTAEDLLKEIMKEREDLIKAGKIKKDKPLPEITDDEVPFNIPKSWKWVRLGEIFQHNSGKQLNSGNKIGTLLTYITTSNLYWNSFVLDDLSKMYFEDGEIERCTAIKGDLLVCEGGDIGRAAIWNYEEPIRLQNHIHKLRKIFEIDVKYYYFVLYLYKFTGKVTGNGIGILSLSSTKIHNMVLPLPPISEQNRIVSKIEEFLTEIDNIERLNLEYSSNHDALKQKIIEAGIKGKLVPQIASEGTAEDLLKEIMKEREDLIKEGKIKKEKPLPEITDDEVPFNIPKSWKWVRLGDISNFGMNELINPDDILDSDWILELEDIEKDSGKVLVHKTKGERFSKSTKHRFVKGNVLYSKLRPYLNKVLVANDDGYCTSEIHAVDFGNNIVPEYAMSFLKSNSFLSYANSCSYGVNMPRLGTYDGRNALFPLPPLAEQERIVAMIEKLTEIIDNI